MKAYIEERILEEADYILETKATIRKTAKVFGNSRSTVHKDLSTRLVEINPQKAKEVKKILNLNFQEKHIRGGQSIKLKFATR